MRERVFVSRLPDPALQAFGVASVAQEETSGIQLDHLRELQLQPARQVPEQRFALTERDRRDDELVLVDEVRASPAPGQFSHRRGTRCSCRAAA